MLFEAGGDLRLFGRFVRRDTCDLTFAYNKATVIEVLAILEADNFPLVLGLVDSDHDRIVPAPSPSANLVSTDCHDIETMIIRSSATKKIVDELATEQKLRSFENEVGEVTERLAGAAFPIGLLRLHSSLCNLRIRFDGIRYSRFVDPTTLSVDIAALIDEVKNHSQRPELREDELQAAITDLRGKDYDVWEICNGHDLVAILLMVLRERLGSRRTRGLRIETLEWSLRVAYEDAHFRKSGVFRKIREWENRNNAIVLK